MTLNAQQLIGSCDVLFITLDTLRFDVAQAAIDAGETPFLASILPGGRWQERHAPGSFTFASHQAFFAGFLPTPKEPGPHLRLFALDFPGSETTGPGTCVFTAPDIVQGLSGRGYFTLCVGGVGFFNRLTPLGRVLPDLFDEAFWCQEFGVTDRDSTRHQVRWTTDRVQRASVESPGQRLFLFLNVSAIHQPNRVYVEGASEDSLATHRAALRYVDGELAPLFAALQRRGPTLCIVCSDHGSAYGEDGYCGHRLAHPTVWNVPYAEFLLPAARG